ncbi:SDR family oxidoreductase [Bailinhaonella thermotolerans]|uniref:NAD-dependent epimerase/dehydratase family protein n=1 Tax=Bailinhaonella thermotolerans TaxID=1070861 RepID=A0A3A4B8Y0_9ACTN|nr:NAD(P)H-binding protein [Bailinhaonella thermotolerans]RJL35359.1 NAD-dependent epimerase/dehydratase family protein [Bailinhaonella thermotolerans]
MIVVTGATGNVGRTLVRLLAGQGHQVTAVSRRITPADVPSGVRAVAADLSGPSAEAPSAADAVFLLVSGDLMMTGDPAGVVAPFAGSGRIVLLSSLGVASRPESLSHGRAFAAFERAVMDSGAEWTILRPGGFASNAYAWAPSIKASRTAAAPFGDVGIPDIDPDDIAAVAAATLTSPGHAEATYELTGPAPITPRQRAAAIADAIGEPVTFLDQTREEARAQMLAHMPAPVADTTLDVLGAPTPHEQRVSPNVEKILGRAPGTFAAWAQRNAAAFR